MAAALMRVLIANNLYPPIMAGGAELIVSYLAEELSRRGHEVTVVTTCSSAMEPYPVETRHGVEVIRFFPKNVYWSFDRARDAGVRERSGANRWQSALQSAAWHARDAWNRDAFRRLRVVLAKTRPDVFHTHVIDGFSGSIWAAAKRLQIPVIHTAHDYHLLCPRAFLLSRSWQLCEHPQVPCRAYRKWHIRTTRHVDLFASPSEFLLNRHVAAGLESLDSIVIRNGIPISGNIAKRPSTNGQRFLLMTRLTVEKGVRVAIEAMRLLPKDAPIRLLIAGRGPLEQDVREAAAADPRIEFHGFVQGDHKRDLLASADHLVLPSAWYENAPTVILEAAASGRGILASRIGGIPEFIRPGRTGYLFEAGNARALAEGMVNMAGNKPFREAVGREGPDLASNFTVDKMTDAYVEAYTRLSSRS